MLNILNKKLKGKEIKIKFKNKDEMVDIPAKIKEVVKAKATKEGICLVVVTWNETTVVDEEFTVNARMSLIEYQTGLVVIPNAKGSRTVKALLAQIDFDALSTKEFTSEEMIARAALKQIMRSKGSVELNTIPEEILKIITEYKEPVVEEYDDMFGGDDEFSDMF